MQRGPAHRPQITSPVAPRRARANEATQPPSRDRCCTPGPENRAPAASDRCSGGFGGALLRPPRAGASRPPSQPESGQFVHRRRFGRSARTARARRVRRGARPPQHLQADRRPARQALCLPRCAQAAGGLALAQARHEPVDGQTAVPTRRSEAAGSCVEPRGIGEGRRHHSHGLRSAVSLASIADGLPSSVGIADQRVPCAELLVAESSMAVLSVWKRCWSCPSWPTCRNCDTAACVPPHVAGGQRTDAPLAILLVALASVCVQLPMLAHAQRSFYSHLRIGPPTSSSRTSKPRMANHLAPSRASSPSLCSSWRLLAAS